MQKNSMMILAIDPFEKRARPSRGALRELRFWARRLGVKIEAVYVLNGSDREPLFHQRYTSAYDKLNLAVRNLELGVPVRCRVIWDHEDGLKEPAHVLVDYVREREADLVFVSSHARKWFSRMMLGSFAERVMLTSPVPVLFFGLLASTLEKFNRVMFATDFSESSKLAYLQFLEHVRPLRPEVILFHVPEYPNLITGMSLTGVGAYLPDTYWKVMKESIVSEGESWVKIAKNFGVSARVLIEDTLGDITGAIEKTAKLERVSLIGVASIRNQIEKVLLGSVSTHLFRSHQHSIWVCGPKAFERLLLKQAQKEEDRGLHP